MRIALAQINVTVGDFVGNLAAIVAAARDAYQLGARLVVMPELVLSGYPPEDLLLRPSFYAASATALTQLAAELSVFKGLHVVVGHPHRIDAHANRPLKSNVPPSDTFNAASVLLDGHVLGTYLKQVLPNTEVFDERRYFATDPKPYVFELDGVHCAILICEDIWYPTAVQEAKAAGAQLLLVPNGSPYHLGKENLRTDIVGARIRESGLPIVYVNNIGAQDELVFDGGSFVCNAQGECVARMPQFEAGIALVEFDGATPQPSKIAPELSLEAQVYAALVVGVRDYVEKNHFPGVLIGLSGGVDSALVLAVACDALGPERVRAVMMPSCYTAEISIADARQMASRLNVRYDEIEITSVFDTFRLSLAKVFDGLAEDTTEENIQARIRGTLLMALSNKSGSIVLTTGNKSEMAVGYCTLYGDMAGGFAVIKDIAKTLVYRLCRYRNTSDAFVLKRIIPERILTRAPSAELRANQTDQDSLPPYEVLDAIMQQYMEEGRSGADIVAAGFKPEDVARITRLIKLSEYKRRQAPIGLRITSRAFGRDWRYPITSRFNEVL
ncbi:hypothetical protein BGZ96_004881 [Linnemannia gamsii]|uniref:Glutamine-dependent NAD(+) synthetase n=1 Tax=Linnemannia gamsii TaxID=64522 RepID=A0ABQ7K6A2_9FUNG|nr:hypothetical protein BGZ96_004881 [Linnemannia gamsii]